MSLTQFLLAALVVMAGSIVQAVSGVGGGFIIVPLLASIDVNFVPGPMIFASLFLSGTMAFVEREYIDYAHVIPINAGLLPGAMVGAWLLSVVSPERLGIMFGSVILAGIVIALTGISLTLTRLTAIAAGFVSGAMGASSGIGAPVLALMHQAQSGPRIRATLALYYSMASVMILVFLSLFDRFGIADIQTGLLLVPGSIVGYVISKRIRIRLQGGGPRYAVLGVSAVAALTLTIQSLP